jgi:hypothetical protein
MLLAGVAALALLAGGGIAAAQQSPQGQNGAGISAQGAKQTPPAKPSGAAAGMEQHAQTGSPSRAAASPDAKTAQPSMARRGTDNAKSENRSAQVGQNKGENAKQSAQSNESKQRRGESAKENTKENTQQNTKQTAKTESKSGERIGAAEKNGHERMGANTRERGHERVGANTRSERGHSRISERSGRKNELKGLQGNASIPMQGSHVNLTSQQRTTIRDSVIDARGAPRVGHVDFGVTVGTLVPRDRVHVVRVPETLVRIHPQWHGYLYFIVEDQVVIVNPRDMRIVAVLDV